MNPDLAMGDDLLKTTGSGNLFMVFGERDVEIRKGENGKLTVEINGVDVYDPTTGVIRSNSTDDIACWFIDTNYDAESFFVRHAYFTGADRPYEKLQKTLRAEIDEDAWAAIHSTVKPPVRSAENRQDRRQGNQPLRRRGAEGLRRGGVSGERVRRDAGDQRSNPAVFRAELRASSTADSRFTSAITCLSSCRYCARRSANAASWSTVRAALPMSPAD